MTRKDSPSAVVFSLERLPEQFLAEVGLHKWQRVPPTEKRGRVHTSVIAVMLDEVQSPPEIDPSDLVSSFTCSGGKGGQNVNRRQTAAILKHIPTGITVRCEDQRTQGQNLQKAKTLLIEKLRLLWLEQNRETTSQTNQTQWSQGSSSSEVQRTVKVQHNIVKLGDRKISYLDYLKGKHLTS